MSERATLAEALRNTQMVFSDDADDIARRLLAWWIPEHDEQVRREAAAEQREQITQVLLDLVDPDDCWFDHHGGCQAHGYLSLKPGELCPVAAAKRWIAAAAEADTDG